MKNYEVKDIATVALDVDTAGSRVKVAISKMGNLDLDGDVIDKTAYNRTIKERGPKGANLIWHLTDHRSQMSNAIAKFKELYVEDDYLVGVTDVPATTLGKDMLIMYQAGHINQHSVGFRTLNSEPQKAGTSEEYRLIKEILLYEGSAVLWGANPETPTLSVGKSLTKEEAEKDFLATTEQINNLAKLLRQGKLSDTSLELLEIDFYQKTERLKQLYEIATLPAEKALDPVKSNSLKAIDDFINSL